MEISRTKSDFWFACVDIAVIKDEKLSPCDKAIYMTFCAHADVKTRKTPLSVKKLADETGCGIRTAQKSIKTLIERGVLERREQYKDGRQLTSSYRLIGHNAGCYRSSDVTEKFLPALPENPIADLTALEGNDETRCAILAEAAENDFSGCAESAGHAENYALGGAESAHRYLEPIFNENQNITPLPPKGRNAEKELILNRSTKNLLKRMTQRKWQKPRDWNFSTLSLTHITRFCQNCQGTGH
jgi:hypothetical protein